MNNGHKVRARKGKKIAQRKALGNPVHPPQLRDLQISHSVRLRFFCNAAYDGNVTWQNLLDCVCTYLGGGITAANLFVAVRIRGVEMWAVPVIGNSNTVSLTFKSANLGETGDYSLHSDTSMGISPAHVLAKPSKHSTSGMWQPSSTGVAFNILSPAGTVIDLMLSFRGQYGFGQLSEASAAAGGVVGAVYLRGFDGLAIATTKFTPLGVDSALTI